MKKPILITLFFLNLSIFYAESQDNQIDSYRISKTVAYALPTFHLNQLPFDDYISTNAFNLFLTTLDPSRSYFLNHDVDKLNKQYPDLHKKLRKGNISFATNAYAILLERMNNRLAFTDALLEKGFDTNLEEDFLWDRSEANWSINTNEWNNLWRKRIKNEYIGRLINEHLDQEEKISETESTMNTNSLEETVSDEYTENTILSPEEFILDRYKQLILSMESFDQEMILQRYLSSFSQVYDPHSDYLSPSNVEDFNINMKLSLVGIGAMLRPDDGAAKIVRLIPGGPAETDGRLKEGDKIIAVTQEDGEEQSIMHWPLYKAVRLIRGEKDTKVVLTVISESDGNNSRSKKIDLIRDEVKLEEQAAKGDVRSIKTSSGVNRNIGIITLPDFYADFNATNAKEKDARRASTDIQRIIQDLQKEQIEGLILDLRNNGGGSLVEAIEIAGLFIPSGPIVQVKERRSLKILPDADPEVNYSGPLIILVNRLSASASEILAAALQDYNRAIIIGDEHTHGKGTVQTLMPLGRKKGSLKLTTASYYRINGGSTQLRGVEPDIIIPSMVDIMDIGEKELQNALPWDTIRPALYRTNKGYDDIIPALTEASMKRRNQDSEFQVFLDKRNKLKERYASKTVSLVLSNRLAEAEIDDYLDGRDDEDDEADDLILKETLQIFGDWLDLENESEVEIATIDL